MNRRSVYLLRFVDRVLPANLATESSVLVTCPIWRRIQQIHLARLNAIDKKRAGALQRKSDLMRIKHG